MEVYPVGSTVLSSAVGNVGGLPVAMRVIDSYYEPHRSLFGARKYTFRLVTETLVALGGEFVAVSFETIIGEWIGTRTSLRGISSFVSVNF